MSRFITFLCLILFCSCSVKKDMQAVSSSTLDSDGDSVSDERELALGRSPLLANLPELKVGFLQNYSIAIKYLEDEEEKEFKVDTKTYRGHAGFQYRVGNIMARDIAF